MTNRFLLAGASAAMLTLTGVAVTGCKKDEPAAGAAAAPAGQVAWDPKSGPVDGAPEWPVSPESLAAATAEQFAKKVSTVAGPTAPAEFWNRLKDFDGSYLKNWRAQLQADPASATDVVDAFNELAIQVTGPTGFWRKTVPEQWLGCKENGETPPCQKMAELKSELAQWDAISQQISALPPEKAKAFVQKNLARMNAYLDTYVPVEPSSEAMKKTAFFQKHLATLLDGMM